MSRHQPHSSSEIHVDSNGLKRRTIMAGAAWTIPVIATATATPAMAASGFACPTTPPGQAWIGPTNFGGDRSGTGSYGWGDSTTWWNTKDATHADTFSYDIEFSLDVVAGHTYTFDWKARAGSPGNSISYVAYDVLIAGSRVYTASSDGNAGGGAAWLDPNPGGGWVSASHSYTATSDQTIMFVYRVRLSQLNQQQEANHDLTIETPTITCS